MNKKLLTILSVLLAVTLLAACSGAETAPEPAPEQPAESGEQAENVPDQPEEEPAPEEPAVSLEFDPHAYQNTDDDEYFNALVYATNSTDAVVSADLKFKAFDGDGNVISVYNPFGGNYREDFKQTVYVPAGAADFPIGFTLPSGFGYNYETGEEMPEIDHLEFELLGTGSVDAEDLKEHFTPGEPDLRENHIYLNVKIDQEIADNYASIYPDYTLLGYANGELTAVICNNDFPYSTSSMSVDYMVNNNDSSMLIYHSTYISDVTVDQWELYLGCIGGAK